MIDSIQFSDHVIPEPGIVTLSLLAVMLLGRTLRLHEINKHG